MTFIPYAISWNLTARCNLACGHCYLDATARNAENGGELSTSEALDVVNQIARLNPEAVLILTGGEPLLRPDIHTIVAAGAKAGLMVVMGTNGTLLDAASARRLKEAGLSGVGVSVDSLNPEIHDTFRGSKGALELAINGLTVARDAGLNIQVQTTVMTINMTEVPLIAQWAHMLGAKVYNLFFLICTGRGETMADLSPDDYEETLQWAASEKDKFPGMLLRPKCAPHFKRILHQRNPDDGLLSTYVAACRAGTHYMRITPQGAITPCPYMETEAGSLLQTPLADIWNEADTLTRYRKPVLHDKCGRCQYRLLCGGCRARALALTGDDRGEDSLCVYEPDGVEEAIETVDTDAKYGKSETAAIHWATETEDVLAKIPFFARPMVRMGVERKAIKEGVSLITLDYMKEAAPTSPRMFTKPEEVTKKNEPPRAEEIPWDDDAWARVKDAPPFVRPGIPKLMQKRARERDKTHITTRFLSEIRDESMMLASRRIKKLGFGELDMEAWDNARERLFKKSPDKQNVIDSITTLLNGRDTKNDPIVTKFQSFMADDMGQKIGWAPAARKRMEKAPAMVRAMAQKGVEQYALENGYRLVTEEALEKAMAASPFGSVASDNNATRTDF